MKRLLLLPFVAMLASCATHLNQEQCLTINWQSEGFNDGVAGRPPRDLTPAMQDCAQFGITVNVSNYQKGWHEGAKKYCTPDYNVGYTDGLAGKPENVIYDRMPICQQAGTALNLTAYKSGRLQGLQSFCTYENGENLARRGLMLPDVCPSQLRAKFNAGWTNGKNQFCNQPGNAFALGKTLKPYPELCPPDLYAAFRSEYDRGAAIGQRMGDIQNRLNDLNDRISSKVDRFGLVQYEPDHYRLGRDKSHEAQEALDKVEGMIRERHGLEKDLFNLQVMG